MLQLPDVPPIYRIMSIDPGTDTLGVAIIDINLLTRAVSLIHVTTLFGGKRAKQFPDIMEIFGERHSRLYSLKDEIYDILITTNPNCIISESSYMGKFAAAFEAGVESLWAIRDAVGAYDPGMCLETIDPSSVKKSVGLLGKSEKGGNKDGVRTCVLSLSKLINLSGKNLADLDSHSIDAIAVGCYKIKSISSDLI